MSECAADFLEIIELKKRSKRAMLKTWFHSTRIQDASSTETESIESELKDELCPSISMRSKGQSPSEVYDCQESNTTVSDTEELSGTENDDDFSHKNHHTLTRKKLHELKENLKINLDRIRHSRGKFSLSTNKKCGDDNGLDNENISLLTTESEEKDKLSCYRSFRTAARDLDIFYDYAMTISASELGKYSSPPTNRNFGGSLFRKLVYEDNTSDYKLELSDKIDPRKINNHYPVSEIESVDTSSLNDSIYSNYISHESVTDSHDRNENEHPPIVDNNSNDLDVYDISNVSKATKRLLSRDGIETNGSKRQRFNLDDTTPLTAGSDLDFSTSNKSFAEEFDQSSRKVSSNKSQCAVQVFDSKLIPPTDVKIRTHITEDENGKAQLQVEEVQSTSTSRKSSDSSKLYTIPTFREKSEQLSISGIVSSFKNGFLNEEQLQTVNEKFSGQNLSFRNKKFYDILPTDFFEKPIDPMESSDDDEDIDCGDSLIKKDADLVSSETNSVRFNENSKLFIYTPKKKFVKMYQVDSNAEDSGNFLKVKPILKAKYHASTEIETARAMCCDIVNVESFLTSFKKYEEKRYSEEKENAKSRENQINRYYSKEISPDRWPEDKFWD